jgi:hypothetical protein
MFQNITPLEQGILVLGAVIIVVELLAISSLISRNAKRKLEIKRMNEIMENISEELRKAQQQAADEVLNIWEGVVLDIRRNKTAPILYRRIGEGENEEYEPYNVLDYIVGNFYELFKQRVIRRFYREEKEEEEKTEETQSESPETTTEVETETEERPQPETPPAQAETAQLSAAQEETEQPQPEAQPTQPEQQREEG